MRQLLIISAILCNCGLVAQPTFNLVYDNGSRTELSFFSTEVGNSGQYLVTTSSFGGVVDELQVLKIDFIGIPIDTLRLNIPGKHFFPENLVQTPDSNYIATGTLFETNPDDGDFFIYKFSAALDSIWFSTYEFGIGNEGAKKIKPTSDGGFIVVGFSQTFPNNDAQNYLFKIDSTGQKEWELIHGDTTRNEEPYDVVQLQDSSFLVLSRRVYPDNDNILLLRISPNGTLLWEKEVFSPYPRIGASLIPSSDTSFLVAGIAETSDPRGFPFIECFDTNGTSKWFKFYESAQGQLWHGQKLNDTAFVFAGAVNRGNGNGGIQGYLIKVNREGKLIWKRTISPYGQADDPSNDYFYGVLATSDGGLLCTGFTGQGPVSNTQDAWIMKLDSTGLCDTATCFPWLVSVAPPTAQEPLQVWPNPANDNVFITLPIARGILRILDLQGREIGHYPVSSLTHTIAVQHLPQGLYLLTWEVDGEIHHTSKVAVQ